MDLHPNQRCIFIGYKNADSQNLHTINVETTPDCIVFKPAKAHTNIAKVNRKYAQSDGNLRGRENLKILPNNIDVAERDNDNFKTITADTFKTSIPATRRYVFVENVTKREIQNNISGAKNMSQTKHKDRVTYCHPTRRHYSQEFVEKTLDTNAKLHKLLKNLVQDTEKGKKTEMWDKYIKELKCKHRYNLKFNKIAVDVTGSRSEKANGYACKDFNVRTIYENRNDCAPRTGVNLASDNFCYPMSSQGRYMMLNNCRCHAKAKILPNPMVVKCKAGGCCGSCFGCSVRTRSTQLYKHDFRNCPECIVKADIGLHTDSIDLKQADCNECSAVQVPYNVEVPKSHNKGSMLYKYEIASNRFDFSQETKLPKSTQTSSHEVEQTLKSSDLASIQTKLSQLMNCFNDLAQEIKVMKCSKVNKSTAMIQGEIKCVRVEQPDNVARYFGLSSRKQESIETILCEEQIKSDSIKKLIDEIVTKNMSPQNTVTRSRDYLDDIPTKEHATEVTESLYKANQEVKSELGKMRFVEGTEDRNMTIAVNTEPLGLSALIRISADTLRRLLSILPSLDCYEYLSMMRFSAPTRYTDIGSRYTCNICGATFHLPSELSAHIQLHNLGNVRNCCVCHQCIDSARNKSNLFPCQYCGQMFTRAYCRELHEQACAVRMGIIHDVTPSRVMLT